MRFQSESSPKFSLPIALLAAQSAVAQSQHVESRPYPTVTDERLQHPEAGDWLMYRRTYDGSGFSPLKQITATNVGKLSLAWSLNTDLVEAHENDTDRESRADLHHDTRQQRDRTGCQDWHPALAVREELSRGPFSVAPDQSRRCALWCPGSEFQGLSPFI
jgi:hypothetical protein